MMKTALTIAGSDSSGGAGIHTVATIGDGTPAAGFVHGG